MNLRSKINAVLAEPEDSSPENSSEVPAKPGQGSSANELSSYERFRYPFRFQPSLKVSDAALLSLRALLRIFLVSLLCGTWGACAVWILDATRNPYLRTVSFFLLTSALLAAALAMLVATGRIARIPRIWGKRAHRG